MMNKLIQELANLATETKCDYNAGYNAQPGEYYTELNVEKFAKLIALKCCEIAKSEIIDDKDIETEYDPVVREYLKGNNVGVVDVICTIKEHFGVE